MPTLTLHALEGLGEIEAGVDLGALLARALLAKFLVPSPQDVLVIAQKIVSKAEGRICDLETIEASELASELAAITGKDPRLVQIILNESKEVMRARPNVLIVRHRLGFVVAQAGVDRSNVPGDNCVLLLPADPDRSALAIHASLARVLGAAPAVIVSDSFGRAWRLGTTNVAIGAAGVPSLWDRRGEQDRGGRNLQVTQVAWADAIAGAAGLLMGEGSEGIPAVLVQGLGWRCDPSPAQALIRPEEEDLFR